MTERERQVREELLKLMQENPELPVIPMVNRFAPGNVEIKESSDLCWYQETILECTVDEYLISEHYNTIELKSADDIKGTLYRCLTEKEFFSIPDFDDEYQLVYNSQPWKKAIFVYIRG